MNNYIENIRKTREFLLGIINTLSVDELNKIPNGFVNNIIWNLGHMVAAQQGVCYRRAGLAVPLEGGLFETYMPGSKPESPASQKEIEQIKILLFSTLDKLEADYQNQLFGGYTAWVTRYGVSIVNIDEAINFLQFHEGLHVGYIMALKRAIAVV